MLVVAGLGLVVNVVSVVLLRSGARESLNVEGAYVDVLADSVASLGVIGAGVVIAVTDWEPIDAIVAIAIGVWIVPRAWRLAASALRILRPKAERKHKQQKYCHHIPESIIQRRQRHFRFSPSFLTAVHLNRGIETDTTLMNLSHCLLRPKFSRCSSFLPC